MAREIPEVVRAAAGLAATVLDEARRLPETLPGLPVRILGLAMQQAMKVQQQYAGLVARGDELFTGLRGEDEPGLATFDDDEPSPASAPIGYRNSAFDRAGDTPATSAGTDLITDEEVEELPADPAADAVTSVVDELAEQVEEGLQAIEELVEEAPEIEEILDEIAIDELVDQAPTLEETAPPALTVIEDVPATEDAAVLESALLASGDTPVEANTPAEPTVDVLTPAGEIATVEAAVTDEGIAAPESPEDATAEAPVADAPVTGSDAPTAADTSTTDTPAPATDAGPTAAADEPEAGSEPAGSQAVGAAPVDGYDSFSIAQLRGRLRGYTLSTVQDLLAYEEATRAREPYLRMLRNRLEKLEEQAVASSPLAPRGA
jgi:hypothetical protein